jgi:N6-adenosine-specific RNA methylase IME4
MVRGASELFAIAKRGSPPRIGTTATILGVIETEDGTLQIDAEIPDNVHSRKPDAAYAYFRRAFGAYGGRRPRRLELFARQARVGWDIWGDQITKFDIDSPF